MKESKFIIEGMSSQNCVLILVERLKSVSYFQKVEVNLNNKMATIFSEAEIQLSEIQELLRTLPEYSAFGLEDCDTQAF